MFPTEDKNMSDSDLDVVAPLIMKYLKWIKGEPDGVSSDELLKIPLTLTQRKILLARMDDINVLWGMTAPIRELDGRG